MRIPIGKVPPHKYEAVHVRFRDGSVVENLAIDASGVILGRVVGGQDGLDESQLPFKQEDIEAFRLRAGAATRLELVEWQRLEQLADVNKNERQLCEQPPSALNKLTLTGRMLLLIHLMVFIGDSALYICDFLPQFPAGNYPILMFVIPVGLVCFFLFLALAWILERVGIKVYKR